MAEESRSALYRLRPLTDRLPAVTRPEGHVHFRTKMFWVLLILVLYFVMTNIFVYGLDRAQIIDFFSSLRAILAGAQGSILHLGIGPIVTGSIIMQLFAGAKIIKLDLTNDEDKAVYQGTQKFLVILMIFVEGVPQVFGFLQPASGFVANMDALWAGQGERLALTIIVLQIAAGAYLVFLMDEVVSKWGIGSGISLFIAAGVSQQLFTGTFNWEAVRPTAPISVNNPPAGTVPKTIYFLQSMDAGELAGGGFETILLQNPNSLVALVGTIIIFLAVAYVESTRVELPLAHGVARGARGRYPIKLMYASVLPIILIAAVLANIQMFSLLFWQNPEWPLVGRNWLIGAFPAPDDPLVLQGVIDRTTPIGGLAFYVSPVQGLSDWLLPLLNPSRYGYLLRGQPYWKVLLHLLSYVGVMVVGSIVFAKFWVETANLGPEAVARQIEQSGMQIPGFRRDPRILRRVLDRYIPTVTIISGAAIGLLAVSADLVGTVGQAGGTGVLLAVGVLIQFYELIGREQMMEMHPILRQFFA